jgi:hypothetical protein
MNKNLPDKWIRKAVFDAANDMNVGGVLIPVFDYRVTGDNLPEAYVLMSTQDTQVDKNNKCEWFYDSQILLDVVTAYEKAGNTGSRLSADNILDALRDKTKDLQLDGASNLEIITITQDFPSDLVGISSNENVFRKFLRLELTIN